MAQQVKNASRSGLPRRSQIPPCTKVNCSGFGAPTPRSPHLGHRFLDLWSVGANGVQTLRFGFLWPLDPRAVGS